MKIDILLTLITGSLCFFTAGSYAQNADAIKTMERAARTAYGELLKETDKNKDGKISKSEFYAMWKDKKVAEEKFIYWDVNKDGYITEEEYVKVVRDIGTKKKK